MSKSGVNEEGLNELGRRLAAAYISYVMGRKGIDRTLKSSPEPIGPFWRDLADLLFCAMSGRAIDDEDLRLKELATKYIQ